ncbi:hypothetical protein PUN28_010155 [Cardiocondyla obscurior]|uniref:Uncharacterized protein n=1 Tax=Cardiocondyla obscurior TaxID=286306 RepID=A0AAW2FNW3_9HYME
MKFNVTKCFSELGGFEEFSTGSVGVDGGAKRYRDTAFLEQPKERVSGLRDVNIPAITDIERIVDEISLVR